METTLCSFCRHQNPPAAKFCNACGSSLKLQLCPHCGAIDNVGALTCYKCGQPHAAEGERAMPAENDTLTPRAAAGDDGPRQAPAVRRTGLWAAAVALLLAAVGAVLLQRMWRGGEDLPASEAAPPAAATARSVVAERAAPPIRPQQEASAAPGTEPIDVSAVPPPEEAGAPPSAGCSPAVAALGLCDHQAK